MSRKMIVVVLAVLFALMLVLVPVSVSQAGVSNLRLSNGTCSGVTATVAYDGVTGAPTPNTLRFTPFRVDGGGDVALTGESTIAVPGAAQDVVQNLVFPAQTAGSTIRIRVRQLNNTSGTVSTIDTTYVCSASLTPTPTPTPIDARDREQNEGITRIYSGIGDAVIYKMPSSDVQFYRLEGSEGIWVGTAPYNVMDQALYQPNQLVAQYTGIGGWRVDLYYHGWDQWRAIFYTPAGTVHADVLFPYGNPNAGLPPVDTGGAIPGQVVPGQPAGDPGVFPPQGFIPPANLPVLQAPDAPVYPVPPPALRPPLPQLQPPQPGIIVPAVPNAPALIPPGGQTSTAGLVVVAQFSVNMRTAPRRDAPVLTGIAQGASLMLLGRDRTGFWVLAATDRGLQGWVAMQYLSANLAQIRALPVVQ